MVTRARSLQDGFDQHKTTDVPMNWLRHFRQVVATSIADECDVRHEGAFVEGKSGRTQIIRKPIEKSAQVGRHPAATYPSDTVVWPATHAIEPQIESIVANLAGYFLQYRKLTGRHRPDESQRHVQTVALYATSAAEFGRNDCQGIERLQRFFRWPECEEHSSQDRFSHATEGRQLRWRCLPGVLRNPSIRWSCP